MDGVSPNLKAQQEQFSQQGFRHGMSAQQAQAYQLYVGGQLTQKQIADAVGVTVRTIYTWIRTFAWQRVKDAAVSVPTLIAEKISAQIVSLLNAIERRPEGERFTDYREAVVLSRLVNCLDKFKKYPTLSQTMQSVRGFLHFVDQRDYLMGYQLHKEYNAYFQQQAQHGFRPHQVEYDTDPMAFIQRDMADEEKYLSKDEEPMTRMYSLFSDKRSTSGAEAEPENLPESIDDTGVSATSGVLAEPEVTGSSLPVAKDSFSLPPITKEEFEEYRSVLDNPANYDSETILFKGKQVSKAWLQYNLFQYLLIPERRIFLSSELEYKEQVNTPQFAHDIRRYNLSQQLHNGTVTENVR